jgi:hypothetical protein
LTPHQKNFKIVLPSIQLPLVLQLSFGSAALAGSYFQHPKKKRASHTQKEIRKTRAPKQRPEPPVKQAQLRKIGHFGFSRPRPKS